MKNEPINICMNKNKLNYQEQWTANIAGLVLIHALNDIKKKSRKIKTEFMFKKYQRFVIDTFNFLMIEDRCCNFLKLSNFPHKWIKLKALENAKCHYNDTFYKVTAKKGRCSMSTIYRGCRENLESDYKKHYKNKNIEILKIRRIKNIFVDKLK